MIDEDTVLALAYFRRRGFLQRLTAVEAIAREAKEQLDPSALKRSSGQMRDPALFNLVWRARKVWTSMTGRTPSAERTISKTRQTDDPDFVLLVQAIAGLTDKILPSRKQIATALAMSPPA